MKISVIVPVYNVEQYLVQCINSIISQSYLQLEIILVNDGSTDLSLDICNRFATQDRRIEVIDQKNAGVSQARNSGIKSASGDYIAFVDSDDWLDIHFFKKMIDAAKKNEYPEVLMCDFLNVKTNSSQKITSNIREGYYNKSKIIKELYPTLIVTEDLGRLPIVSACTCMFKREFLIRNKINFNISLKYAEDYLFMADVIINAPSFYYLKHYFLYNYRQHDISRSKKYEPKWWDNFLLLNRKLDRLLDPNINYDFKHQIKLQLIHSLLFMSNAIVHDCNIKASEKVALLKKIFLEKEVVAVFSNLKFTNQSFGLKVILVFVKYRLIYTYLFYTVFLAKYKSLINSVA